MSEHDALPAPAPVESFIEQIATASGPGTDWRQYAALGFAQYMRPDEVVAHIQARLSADMDRAAAELMAYGTASVRMPTADEICAPFQLTLPKIEPAPAPNEVSVLPEPSEEEEDKETVKCACCGDDTPDDQTVTVAGGDEVCADCESDHYFTCHYCGDLEHVNNQAGPDTGGNDICTPCAESLFVYSGPMECYVRSTRAIQSDQGNYATRSWAIDNWFLGYDDNWYESEDDLPSNDDDGNSVMYGYHDKDVLDVCGWDPRNKRDALVFGVELEMEPKDGYEQDQRELAERLNGPHTDRYMLAHDGSLDRGVELITQPLTLAQHRRDFNWQQVLKPVLSIAKAGAGTDNCGMHVHINRTALTPLHIGKIMVFLNSPYLEEYMVQIAQRSGNSYCERKEEKLTAVNYERDRYARANLTEHTLEIRMFRSNLRYQRVIKNIEFCDAMVNYTRQCSMRHIESWAKFTEWLLKQKHEYPELVRFLDESKARGFVGAAQLQRVNKKTGQLVKAVAETQEV